LPMNISGASVWIFSTRFGLDFVTPPDCELTQPGDRVVCSVRFTDRISRDLGYEVDAHFGGKVEDGTITIDLYRANDGEFFEPLVRWAFRQADPDCAGPEAMGFTPEEIAASEAKRLTTFDMDEPVIASVVSCADYMVENATRFVEETGTAVPE